MELTWPRRTAGPRSPGVGESLYQLAGAPGPSGGTSSEPLSRSPRLSSSDTAPIEGALNETGADSGRAGNWVGAGVDATGVPGAGGGVVCVGAGAAGAEETLGGDVVAWLWAGASVAQPVRMRAATATKTKWPPRDRLGELSITALSNQVRGAWRTIPWRCCCRPRLACLSTLRSSRRSRMGSSCTGRPAAKPAGREHHRGMALQSCSETKLVVLTPQALMVPSRKHVH